MNDTLGRFSVKWKADPATGCWNWTGLLYRGYGMFKIDGRNMKAQRASWLIHRGPVGFNVCVCHSCDNPACVNPDHLWLGTHQDNIADRHAKGRTARGEKLAHARPGMKPIPPEVVEKIRSHKIGAFNLKAYMQEVGYSRHMAYLIKRGEHWSVQ